MDSLVEVVFVVTSTGDILEWNQPLRGETGSTGEANKEMHPVKLMPDEEKGRIQRRLKQIHGSFFHILALGLEGSLTDRPSSPLPRASARDIL